MQTVDAVRARRTVKHFDANHKMTDEEINQLFSLAMLSPTAFNIQNWRYVLVSDPELREQIKEVAWGILFSCRHLSISKFRSLSLNGGDHIY